MIDISVLSTVELLDFVGELQSYANHSTTQESRDFYNDCLVGVDAELTSREPVGEFRMLVDDAGQPVGFEPVVGSFLMDEWHNCYDDGWQGVITPESFAHPAKFAHGLIRRIYEHVLDEGWLKPGDTVADCFGGVGLGALYAQKAGLNYIGVELELRFVEMARANLALWESRYAGKLPQWGTAQILQGDSRRLSEVIGQAEAIVSSPPYAGSMNQSDGANDTEARIERMRQAGIDVDNRANVGGVNGVARQAQAYGKTPGQLGSMPPGDVQAVISSPPFAGNSGGRGEASRQGIDAALFDRHGGGMKGGTGSDPANLDNLPQGNIQAVISSPPFADSVGSDDPEKRGGLFRDPKRNSDKNLTGTYGDTPGQLGAMKAVISSPPFEDCNLTTDKKFMAQVERDKRNGSRLQPGLGTYGQTAGQIGNESGGTFWEAARDIVNQCHLILTPGGYAIWVVKNYVKAGKVVDFTGQWIALCEACGFELLHHHRAMLVKNHGSQVDIFGETHNKGVARKSFFRRLAERKGSPAIDWESVVCMRKVS